MSPDQLGLAPDTDVNRIRERSAELLRQRLEEISRQNDHQFAQLTLLEWAGLIACTIWISPFTWTGSSSAIHPHVWFSVILGGIVAVPPVLLAWLQPGRPLTRYVIASTQMLMAGMLVHMTGGRIETHFSYFGLLAFMAFYRDWKVLVTATLVIAVDHLIRAAYFPQSMYGVLTVSLWRPVEHIGWVVFEVAILGDFIRRSLRSLSTNVRREACLEMVSEQIASEVKARTGQLAESEQRYRVIFESSPLPMWLCDAETLNFIAANQEATGKYGYSSEEFLKMRATEIEASRDQESCRAFLFSSTGCSASMTHRRHRRKDGTIMDVDVALHPIEWSGRTTLLILSHDISDRVKAEVDKDLMEIQLRHAQKLESIGQLAAGIAHEINTPTQYIGDNLHFLKDAFNDLQKVMETQQRVLPALEQDGPSKRPAAEIRRALDVADVDFLIGEIPKSLSQAIDGVSQVSTLVSAMKEFSHPGTKEKTPADLNSAILSSITVARNEWKYVANMETDLESNLPLVPCLVSDFNQVMLNLIVNASHAIAGAVVDGALGTITISTRSSAEYVEVRVKDTGTGIPIHVRDRIFDPFFTTKGVGRGTGQGLAISRSVVVDKHAGELFFETEVGRGTTFVLRLPLTDTPSGEAAAADSLEVPAF